VEPPEGAEDCRAVPIFVVTLEAGPIWQGNLDPIHQEGESEHAAFMQTLLNERFLLLGGPLRDSTENRALLVVTAPTEEYARSRLADDPWMRSRVLGLLEVREWDVRYGKPL
jgi:uncharacterized protein YciI